MKRTLLVVAFAAVSQDVEAQATRPSNEPVVPAKITVLGTIRDTTLSGTLMPDEASVSPSGKLVAFNTDKDLRMWSAATGATTVLLPGWAESIAWTRAGDAIAFARQSDQGNQEFIELLRIDPSTGRALGPARRVSLSPTTGNAPDFSPDGKLIAFPREDGGRRSSLVVVPVDGGIERVLASGFSVRRLRWSADGQFVYYFSFADSAHRQPILYRAPLSGGAPSLVQQFSAGGEPPHVVVDGRAVLVDQPRTLEGSASVLTDLRGTSLARITYPLDLEIDDWSGAARVLGIRERHPRGLRTVSLEDGRGRVLIDTIAEVISAAWFGDGRRVAAIAKYDGVPFIVTVTADGATLRKSPLHLLPSAAFGDMNGSRQPQLSISPDGHYAVFIGQENTTLELIDLATGEGRTLARGWILTAPIWRSDSKTIRLIRREREPGSDPSVREISLAGVDKVVRVLPRSLYPQASWLVDENTAVAFGSAGHTLIPLDGGSPRVLVRVPVEGGGYFSPDRRTFALRLGAVGGLDKAAHRITLVSLADSSRRDVALPFVDMGVMVFGPDGRDIFIRGRETTAAPLNIYAVPLDGTPPRSVAQIDSKEAWGLFSPSPDRKSALVSFGATRSATFVMVDLSDGMSRIPPAKKTP